MSFLVRNKTYQTVIINEGRILARDCIIVSKITNQIKNLEKKGLLKTRKVK